MDQIIKIRVSAEDKAAFEVAAQTAGLALSAWARSRLKVQEQFEEMTVGIHFGTREVAPILGEIAYYTNPNGAIRYPIIFTEDGWRFCRTPGSIDERGVIRDDVCKYARIVKPQT